jgi:TonB family protein
LSSRAIAATIALLVAIATPIAVVRAGQSGPLPLAGTIYDDSGGVLPGVELMLEDSQQFKWQATTDASGRFEFPPVQPGRYVLEATLPGFRTLRNEFTLRSTRDWDRAITLGVGELQETIRVSAQRPAAASVPSSAQPQRIRVGGNIRPPRKLVNVNPVYPATMREAGREGTVPIQAIIGVDGSVTSLRVLGAEIHPDFAKAAADAVRQWKFTPTLLNGAAVEVVMKVEVTFSLSE